MATKTDEELLAAVPTGPDFVDFPTGWALQRAGLEHTDPRCSAVQHNGGFLCDCGAVEAAWAARRTLSRT